LASRATPSTVSGFLGSRLDAGRAGRGALLGSCGAGEQPVEIFLDALLDLAAKGTEQEAEARRQIERARLDQQAPLDPGTAEFNDVARLALDHRALEAELLLGELGPSPGGLARLGEAEAMLAMDVDVGHGWSAEGGC
jgi:hypothetical protein